MKHFFFFIAFCACICTFAQTDQACIVLRYNEYEQKTPLSRVKIEIKNAGSAFSDAKGACVLHFNNMRPGDKVAYVNGSVQYPGYEVFNKEALEQWTLSRSKDPFRIVMCDSKKFKALRDKYEAALSSNYKQQMAADKRRLDEELRTRQLKSEEYERRIQSIEKDYQQRIQDMQTYIDRFARIDLSELSENQQHLLDLVSQGNIDEAIQLMENQNFADVMLQNLGRRKKIEQEYDHLLRENSADNDSITRIVLNDLRLYADMCYAKGGVYNRVKVDSTYRSVAFVDTTNIRILQACYDYACTRDNKDDINSYGSILANYKKEKYYASISQINNACKLEEEYLFNPVFTGMSEAQVFARHNDIPLEYISEGDGCYVLNIDQYIYDCKEIGFSYISSLFSLSSKVSSFFGTRRLPYLKEIKELYSYHPYLCQGVHLRDLQDLYYLLSKTPSLSWSQVDSLAEEKANEEKYDIADLPYKYYEAYDRAKAEIERNLALESLEYTKKMHELYSDNIKYREDILNYDPDNEVLKAFANIGDSVGCAEYFKGIYENIKKELPRVLTLKKKLLKELHRVPNAESLSIKEALELYYMADMKKANIPTFLAYNEIESVMKKTENINAKELQLTERLKGYTRCQNNEDYEYVETDIMVDYSNIESILAGKAMQLYKKHLQVAKDYWDVYETTYKYGNAMYSLCEEKRWSRKNEEYLKLTEECTKVFEDLVSINSECTPQLANMYYIMMVQYGQNNVEEAMKYGFKGIVLYDSPFGRAMYGHNGNNRPSYLRAYLCTQSITDDNHIANLDFFLDRAARIEPKDMKNLVWEDLYAWGDAYYDLYDLHRRIGDWHKAEEYGVKAAEIYSMPHRVSSLSDEIIANEHPAAGNMWRELQSITMRAGEYEKSIVYGNNSIEAYKKYLGDIVTFTNYDNRILFVQIYYNLTQAHMRKSQPDVEKAIESINTGIDLCEPDNFYLSSSLLDCIRLAAQLYLSEEKYDDLVNLLARGYRGLICSEGIYSANYDFYSVETAIANAYADNGDNNKAHTLYNKIVQKLYTRLYQIGHDLITVQKDMDLGELAASTISEALTQYMNKWDVKLSKVDVNDHKSMYDGYVEIMDTLLNILLKTSYLYGQNYILESIQEINLKKYRSKIKSGEYAQAFDNAQLAIARLINFIDDTDCLVKCDIAEGYAKKQNYETAFSLVDEMTSKYPFSIVPLKAKEIILIDKEFEETIQRLEETKLRKLYNDAQELYDEAYNAREEKYDNITITLDLSMPRIKKYVEEKLRELEVIK